MDHILVIGGGVAGDAVADTLRSQGFAGRVTLVGSEPNPPYDRPPLSKQLLAGLWEPARLTLRKHDHYAVQGIEIILGVAATNLDTGRRRVHFDNGLELPYDGLVIATGVIPRELPIARGLRGVHTLRSVFDALALRSVLEGCQRVVVIGAGFVGTEVAATVRSRGLEVALVDIEDQPLQGALGSRIGGLVGELHRKQGVRLLMGSSVREIGSIDGRATCVVLDDGRELPADCVVVAIGATPATAWLEGCGLRLQNGVACDEYGLAAPGIYAVGDVASWHIPRLGRAMRFEHRMNAVEQATTAATNMVAPGTSRFVSVPFFWTDQFDARVQAYGYPSADAELHIAEGTVEEGRFVAVYSRHGEVVGVLGWNAPKRLREHRALLARSLATG